MKPMLGAGTTPGAWDPQAGVSFSIAATNQSNPIPAFAGSAPQQIPDTVTIAVTYTNANTQVGTFKVQGTLSSNPVSTDWSDISQLSAVAVVASSIQPIIFQLSSASLTTLYMSYQVVYTSTSSGGADTATIRVMSGSNT